MATDSAVPGLLCLFIQIVLILTVLKQEMPFSLSF